MISLGQYRLSARAPGLTLSELRDKAAEMALIASEHGDVKVHLAARAAAEKTQRQAVVLAQQLATRQGSFEELLNAYAKDSDRSRQDQGKRSRAPVSDACD